MTANNRYTACVSAYIFSETHPNQAGAHPLIAIIAVITSRSPARGIVCRICCSPEQRSRTCMFLSDYAPSLAHGLIASSRSAVSHVYIFDSFPHDSLPSRVSTNVDVEVRVQMINTHLINTSHTDVSTLQCSRPVVSHIRSTTVRVKHLVNSFSNMTGLKPPVMSGWHSLKVHSSSVALQPGLWRGKIETRSTKVACQRVNLGTKDEGSSNSP